MLIKEKVINLQWYFKLQTIYVVTLAKGGLLA